VAGPDLPELDLRHLRRLTDDAGILQHARYTVPLRRSGYSLDDQARALLAVLTVYELRQDESVLPLAAPPTSPFSTMPSTTSDSASGTS
jgi:hypothetical protein